MTTLSYHDLWWALNDPYGPFMASGIHGQRLLVSPGLDLVIVHFGYAVYVPADRAMRTDSRGLCHSSTALRLSAEPGGGSG